MASRAAAHMFSMPPGEATPAVSARRTRHAPPAAAAAVMVGIAGWSLSRPAEPKDTFDDPYLAYAAVEQALMKTSAKMQAAAQKVYETENVIDQLTYWK